MMRWTRRFLWLALLMAAGVALATVARRRAADALPAPAAAPRWPPFAPPPFATTPSAPTPSATTPSATTPSATVPIQPTAAAQGVAAWVLPVDGECPPGYPIKANDNSGIFHVPGGRSYERTKAERCYVDAESAAADGYRAAKA